MKTFCSCEKGIQQWAEVYFVDLKTAQEKEKILNITRVFLSQIHAVAFQVISKDNIGNLSLHVRILRCEMSLGFR